MTLASFLVDTDWAIDHFNGVGTVTRRLQELQKHGLALSIISVAELWECVHFSKDSAPSEAMLTEFISGVVILGGRRGNLQAFWGASCVTAYRRKTSWRF